MPLRTNVHMRSERGPVREKNEDAMGVLYGDDAIDGVDGLVVVADGLGGHEHGEVASGMAVERVRGAYQQGEEPGKSTLERDWEGSLVETLRHVNQVIHRVGLTGESLHRNPWGANMGTTVTAALLSGDTLFIGHIGDSRAYLMRGGELRQLTEDHSLVAEQVRRGLIPPEEAERHPASHVLTQAMGLSQDVNPFSTRLQVQAGDRLLVCSDGLHGFLPYNAIADTLQRHPDESVVDALVDRALDAGSTDNITVVVVRFEV